MKTAKNMEWREKNLGHRPLNRQKKKNLALFLFFLQFFSCNSEKNTNFAAEI